MDTRFWGPPGWRMLHLISFAVDQPYGPKRADVLRFFALLPYVLPCKYCRANLSEHIQQVPLSPATLGKWLWTIHNMANAKLRTQKLPTAADPPFETVKKVYLERLGFGCTRTLFEGWEFLFSIAEAHPMSLGKPEPIAGAPKGLDAADSLERNRWNVMGPEERLPFVTEFLDLLPAVLPFPEWRSAAANGCGGPSDWSTRAAAIKSLWGMRCSMESKLELLNKTSYSSLCKELRLNRSGCGASKRGKTCRRLRHGGTK